MMLVTGAVALAAGLAVAPVLAHGNPGLAGAYRIAFAGAVIAYVGASYTFSLQAKSTDRWNLVRVSQPILALAGIILVWRLRLLTLDTAVGVVIVTMAIQLGYRTTGAAGAGLAPGRAEADLIRPLARYGLTQLAAVTPASVNAYLDQLVLSQLVAAGGTGPLCRRRLSHPGARAAGLCHRQRGLSPAGRQARARSRWPSATAGRCCG